MSVFVINGREADSFVDAVNIVREEWSKHKAPLIAGQKAAGGPKATDPAPAGTDAPRRSPRKGKGSGSLPSLSAEGGD